MASHIIVHPPSASGERLVCMRSEVICLAHSYDEVVQSLRRAGLETGEGDAADASRIEWRGGGADTWT